MTVTFYKKLTAIFESLQFVSILGNMTQKQ